MPCVRYSCLYSVVLKGIINLNGLRKILRQLRPDFVFSILGDPGADSGDEGKSKRAEKCGTKKKKERREEPLRTMSYQTSSKRSPPFWLLIGTRKLVFFWHQSEARTAATVWNWSGKTLSPGALPTVLYFSSFHIYFSARLDFPSPPLSAPGSPRMRILRYSPALHSICSDFLCFSLKASFVSLRNNNKLLC